MDCKKCGSPITKDEAAITKKLINRGTTTYYCTRCLAAAFDVTPDDIRQKIQYFKEIGCTLFQTAPDFRGQQ
ncbi:MAG: hypothetical protein K2N87_17250 [Eubacterium sp.]|nr:hypothetical protein [Eubacterium sp.]